jgi:hypothetical protein
MMLLNAASVAPQLHEEIETGWHVHVSLELTGLLLAGIAGLALWFAWRQVREMQESTRKQADSARNLELQTRANILLTLDQRWETKPMLGVRRELQTLISMVEGELLKAAGPIPADALKLRTAPLFVVSLNQMRVDDFKKYFRLYKICGFFETVGYVSRIGYIPIDDVINLLGGSVLEAGRVFRPHIQRAKEEAGSDQRMYENFLWLLSELEKWVSTSRASAS